MRVLLIGALWLLGVHCESRPEAPATSSKFDRKERPLAEDPDEDFHLGTWQIPCRPSTVSPFSGELLTFRVEEDEVEISTSYFESPRCSDKPMRLDRELLDFKPNKVSDTKRQFLFKDAIEVRTITVHDQNLAKKYDKQKFGGETGWYAAMRAGEAILVPNPNKRPFSWVLIAYKEGVGFQTCDRFDYDDCNQQPVLLVPEP